MKYLKNYLALIILILVVLTNKTNVNAQLYEQTEVEETPSSNSNVTSATRYMFVGFGIGINDYGIGGGGEFTLTNKTTLFGNIGIGGWGSKFGVGVTLYPKGKPFGSGFSFGYAYATGMNDAELELTVEPNNTKEDITLDLEGVSTINLVYSYNFRMGSKSKFVLSAGYAAPLQTKAYTIKNSNVELDIVSEGVLEMLQPGGLIFGVKFMFGI